MNRNSTLHSALAGLIAISAMTAAFSHADDSAKEQCAGVIKGGMNDCATSSNACHGHVAADGNPEAWIYVPKGTCAKIAGARVVEVVDPTPKAK